MFIIIILLLLIVCLFAIDYYVHHTREGRLIDKIPGPKLIPVFGNLLLCLGSLEDLWCLLRGFTDLYYPIVKLWSFVIPFVSIRHPDDLEKILSNTKHIEKGVIYEILHPWFKTGLLTSSGAKWYARRKILTPAFHFNILRQFVTILTEEGERTASSLKESKAIVVKDLIPFISHHTLNAICETAMGTSLQGLGSFQQKYRQAVHQMGKLVVHRLLRPWLRSEILFLLSPSGRQQKKILNILHSFTAKIIAERKLYHERTNYQYLKQIENEDATEELNTVVIGIRRKRLAMLDLLIAASRENYLSDQDIREEVDTFMFEGHDTTAMSICFSLMLLAEHKDIQERVRAEIKEEMQKTDEKVTLALLQNLPYLERCLKESLRLYPSVHFISRILTEDIELQSYNVPAGTSLHLNIFSVHRDPNFWPNPEVFDPDRFLPENSQQRHPYSYLPFSAGSRNCIGQRFAMLELKAIIVPLIHNFYLESVDYLKDVQLIPDLVIRSNQPLRVKFIPIKSV